MASNDIKSELESFREQWRAEVQSKVPVSKKQAEQTVAGPSNANAQPQALSKLPKVSDPPKKQVAGKKAPQPEDEEDEYVSQSFDEAAPAVSSDPSSQTLPSDNEADLVSALDHYEQAVEREAAGNLGDSLRLYRKAYRLDHRVDLQYRKKHFPAAHAPKPPPFQPNPSAASPTVPNPAHHSSEAAPAAKPKSLKELITSFANLTILGSPPEVEGALPPPCPISTLPDEILCHILRDIATADIASFVRLARVCKRLAYLVATEDQVWRRVCLGPEFGFGGMHYRFQTSVTWNPPDPEQDSAVASGPHNPDREDVTSPPSTTIQQTVEQLAPLTPSELADRDQAEKQTATLLYLTTLYSSSWQRMFRLRPRIRFGGCYISTVNYMRSGQASAHATTWHSPVHIVTYYRYLRFFRDGTCISLLSVAEPADVVHHLTREALALHRGGAGAHLPSAAMQMAYKGRWRLGSARDYPDREVGEAEGDVFVETEGVGKYLYRLDLSLHSAGKKGPRNNKLVWRGFYSYNRLTDDWGDFGLKNDKPFFFSRVRSYGVGE